LFGEGAVEVDGDRQPNRFEVGTREEVGVGVGDGNALGLEAGKARVRALCGRREDGGEADGWLGVGAVVVEILGNRPRVAVESDDAEVKDAIHGVGT
jgi:hypothetical protein